MSVRRAGLAENVAGESFEFGERSLWVLAVVRHSVEKSFFVPGGNYQQEMGESDEECLHVTDVPRPFHLILPLESEDFAFDIFPEIVNDSGSA